MRRMDAEDLRSLFASRHPLLLVEEQDEERFLRLLRGAAGELGLPVWIWYSTKGLARDGFDPQYGTRDAALALSFVADVADAAVFAFIDVHPAMADPTLVRRVKDVVQGNAKGQTLVLAAPSWTVPPELAGVALSWKLPPPEEQELEGVVSRTVSDIASRGTFVNLTDAGRTQLADALRGVSSSAAEQLIQQVAARRGMLDDGAVADVRGAKAEQLEGSSPLEVVDLAAGGLDRVGGLENLKSWLALRGTALQPAGQAFGLEPPKGVLLTGVPGCGKSLVAKTLAATWGYPLVLLDPARLYGKYVGESEQRLADALATVQAMAPAVLWIDEIEKGFAQGGADDGGLGERILGTFLRWMQDRPPGVFVIATANEVDQLPPEFLRKGRFDEIFFVDLPRPAEREAIFRLQLAKRKRVPAAFDLPKLAAGSEGYSGSEIETAVVGAMYRAFAAGRDLDTAEILEELAATHPLSRTRAEDIAALRAWAHGRATAA